MSNQSFDEMLNKITSNEELMSKISQVVKNNKSGEISDTLPAVLSLITSNGQDKKEEIEDLTKNTDAKDSEINTEGKLKTDNVAGESQTSNDFTGLIGSLGKQISTNSQLLMAIKPYLNKNRQGMIDTMVRLSSLANVINLGR